MVYSYSRRLNDNNFQESYISENSLLISLLFNGISFH